MWPKDRTKHLKKKRNQIHAFHHDMIDKGYSNLTNTESIKQNKIKKSYNKELHAHSHALCVPFITRNCRALIQNSCVSTGKFPKRFCNFGGNAYLYHLSLALFLSVSCKTLASGLNKAQNSSLTFVSSLSSSPFCLTTEVSPDSTCR